MIRHHFHLQNFIAVFTLFLQKQFFETAINRRHKYLAPVLRAEDNVVLATVYDVTVTVSKGDRMTTHLLGTDFGMGAIKLAGDRGTIELPTRVSVVTNGSYARLAGVSMGKPPMRVRIDDSEYYVGDAAHSWGRPVENMGYDRLTDSPEMRAALYAALAQYGVQPDDELVLYVGLPYGLTAGESGRKKASAVARWLRGQHRWEVEDDVYEANVVKVKPASQATGALYDYVLETVWDEDLANYQLRPIADHAADAKREIGIVSVGFNTVELMVVQNYKGTANLTRGEAVGVQALLEMHPDRPYYTLGEMDRFLRKGQLDVSMVWDAWTAQLAGFIRRVWGNRWKRFSAILLVGGGAVLLRSYFDYYFEGRAIMPEQPVMSIANGLYKLSWLKERR